jgi:hypothetical protein
MGGREGRENKYLHEIKKRGDLFGSKKQERKTDVSDKAKYSVYYREHVEMGQTSCNFERYAGSAQSAAVIVRALYCQACNFID